MTDLRSHRLSVALICPQIAPNTGNIGRLCVATGTILHLVRPMGFILSDRELKRSGMDYWPRLNVTIHDDLPAFNAAMKDTRMWLFSSKATKSLWQVNFSDGDCLVFGSETSGLPSSFVDAHTDSLIRIPQTAGERCLNLSTAAGVGLFEAIRQINL